MLHYYKFAESIPAPAPAREVYVKHQGGRGWPEECPPLRAANAFGWDILSAYPMTFRRKRGGGWVLDREVTVTSGFTYEPPEAHHDHGSEERCEDHNHGAPLTQVNAWFWDKNQKLPHVITDDVYEAIQNQVKVSTFLFLKTDPGEVLYLTDVPNFPRPFRALSAILDTDWYHASYPWHCVLELDPGERVIEIPKGTPLCRLFIVRRDFYFAKAMDEVSFDQFFQSGQSWLQAHGRGSDPSMLDITKTYVKQQQKSKFTTS